MSTLKIVGASATILGIILAVVDRLNAPSCLALEQSPKYQEWLGWAALVVTSVGAVILIFT